MHQIIFLLGWNIARTLYTILHTDTSLLPYTLTSWAFIYFLYPYEGVKNTQK